MPIRSRMSLIMVQIEPGHPELLALEFGILASANIDQSVPNLSTIFIPIRSRMSSITGEIEPEHSELYALRFGKIAESDIVYTPASTYINQSALNLV